MIALCLPDVVGSWAIDEETYGLWLLGDPTNHP